jgi:hypothetical protein
LSRAGCTLRLRYPGGDANRKKVVDDGMLRTASPYLSRFAVQRLDHPRGDSMKYWLDTEFIARPFTIDLISIGMVAEDGREFYAESSETDWSKASPWTLENVRPQLNGKGISRENISYALRNFTDGDEHPVFWGYFPAYDWVASSGFSAASRNCRSTFPSSASTSSNGRLSLAIPSLPITGGAATTLWPTHAGRKSLGVPRKPPSRRGRPTHHRAQEPRPSQRRSARRSLGKENGA